MQSLPYPLPTPTPKNKVCPLPADTYRIQPRLIVQMNFYIGILFHGTIFKLYPINAGTPVDPGHSGI